MKRFAIILTGLGFLLAVALWMAGVVGSSRARIERDHSIRLPDSASNYVCRPFISLSWLWDSGEQATFSLSHADLNEILEQFREVEETPNGLRGLSREGNIAIISTIEQPEAKLLLTIDTTWN